MNIVLRPRVGGKSCQHKVLHRDQYLDLITEMFFEWLAPVGETRAEFPDHPLPCAARIPGAEMVPDTQPNGVGVLRRATPDPPAVLCNVLDRGMSIQMARQ